MATTRRYPCLNPDCPAEYLQSRSLNRHYARNPSCGMFVQDTGSDFHHFGLAASSTQQHSTSLLRLDSQQQSSVNNASPVRQTSNAPVDANVQAPLSNHEQANMSFSFCYSDNGNHSDGSDERSLLFGISPREQLHNPSSSSPPSPMQDFSFSAAFASSPSLNPSDNAPIVTVGTGHFIFVPGDDSDDEQEVGDSVRDEEASGSFFSSAGSSLSNYLDNFALAEAQFEPLQNLDDDPSTSTTTDSDNGTNSLIDGGVLEQEDDVATIPVHNSIEQIDITLLLDSLSKDKQLSSRHQQQVKKLHPAEEELLIIMRKNHMPIGLFQKLMAWAKRASISKYDFNSPTYKTVLDRMKKKYMLTAGSPPFRSTVIVGGPFPPMHVYRFSVLHHIKRLLQNPLYLESASWKFNEEKCPLTGERVFSGLHTSNWWKNADQSLARDLAELQASDSKPPGLHFVCPLILFDDSTLCDNIGRLMAQPVLLTIGNISDALRRQVDAWFILGMVPPYPKSSKERESDRKAKLTTERYMEFYHSCLSAILTEVKELSSRKEGVPVSIPNFGVVNLHLRLCMVIGDTKGHDDMCCHYNCHSSTIARMVRDCNIPQSSGDNPMFPCAFVEQASIKEVVEAAMNAVDNRLAGQITDARKSCQNVSQHLVRSVFWDIRGDGSKYGIFASLPWEMLHLFYLGIMKYMLHALFNYRVIPKPVRDWYRKRCKNDAANTSDEEQESNDSNSDNDSPSDDVSFSSTSTNKEDGTSNADPRSNVFSNKKPQVSFNSLKRVFDKVEFERRFRVVTLAARRQSDRSMPRAPFKNGVTDQSRLTGQEYPGLCLITLIAMKGMLSHKGPNLPRHLESGFSTLIFMSLCLECALTQHRYTESNLADLDNALTRFLCIYREIIGPFRECFSRSGLRIPKFHGLTHSVFYIRRYGSPYNFFGGFCESHLKWLVKRPTKNTSRRQDRLDLDLMNRQHEDMVCVAASDHLREENWWGEILKTEKEMDDNVTLSSNDSDSLMDGKGIKPHKAVFHAEHCKDRNQWRIVHNGKPYHGHVFPVVPGHYGNTWVRALIDSATQDPDCTFDGIKFFFGCDIPSSIPGKHHETLRCHPDFHSYPWERRPWHDWVMVNWETPTRSYHQAAKLLLWAEFTESMTGVSKLKCAVHSLAGAAPKKDRSLPFFHGDKIETNVRVIPAEFVLSVAYVLPSIEKPTDPFPESVEDATYFIVVPPRSSWMELGLQVIDDYNVSHL